jgi:hypothetical protein
MQGATSSSWPVYAVVCAAFATAGYFIFSRRVNAPSADKAPSAAAAKVRRGQSLGRKPAQPGPVEAERRAAPDEAPESNVNSALASMSEEEVEAWLAELGHPDAAKRFREGAISGEVLADLTDTDLEEMGIAPIGERKKVLALVKAGLQSGPEAAAARSRATHRKPSGRHGQSPRR